MPKVIGMYRIKLVEEGESSEILTRWPHKRDLDAAISVEEDAELTGQEIVHHLEDEAESANYHSLCSKYQDLYDLFLSKMPEGPAAELMAGILEMGGLMD